jgi:hypothetical protein
MKTINRVGMYQGIFPNGRAIVIFYLFDSVYISFWVKEEKK